MADEADIANDYIANEVSRALKVLQQKQNNKPVSKNCLDCCETIPAARRKLGFTYCVQCAEERERRNSLFAG